MAVIQRVRSDFGNALHCTGNAGAGRMAMIHGPQHPGVDLPVGVVLDHADLLTDDALLLGNALVGEIGNGHKGQQDPQVFLKMLRGIEIVGRHGVGGEGVGLRAVFRQLLQGVALPGVEHLVLQIMGDARRGVQPLPVQTEPGIHTAVAGGEKGVLFGVAGLRHHADLQSVGQPFPADCLADPLIKSLFHASASFPFRKYTVSSFTVLMARQIRSAVMS